jgi:uncharacterized protein (TIGR03492 family)
MKLFVCSNGYGEDGIALKLIQAYIIHTSADLTVSILPLVGEGKSFEKAGFSVLYKNKPLPSGGFIRGFKSVKDDIRAGLFSQIGWQKKIAAKASAEADLVVCVGDVFCLWVGKGRRNKTVFLPTAKSDTFMPHSWLEKRLIKQWCKKVFPRDEVTTESFSKAGISSHYYGNPMMDGLIPKGVRFSCPEGFTKIGILPGSREEAYQNLAFIFSLPFPPKTSLLIAKSPVLDGDMLERILKDTLNNTDGQIHVVFSEDFVDVVNQSQVILGLAGTANEQAVFMGKSVVCFPGFGPQSSLQRFYEQQKLMGDRILVIEKRDPALIVEALFLHKSDPNHNVTHYSTQNAAEDIIMDCLNSPS